MDFFYLIIFLICSVIKDVENFLLKKIGINKFKDEKILQEPSLLQCAQRCRFIDKNAVVDFKNMECTCIKYEIDEGQDRKGPLIEIFVNQGVMKKIETAKPTKVINVALNRIAEQSTTYHSRNGAENAVDGSLITVTFTKRLDNQWWKVDLENTFDIMYIIFPVANVDLHKNRALIADTSQEENGPWILCKTIGHLSIRYNFTFTCDNPTNARYVKIRSTAICHLNFYQIEVYARVPI